MKEPESISKPQRKKFDPWTAGWSDQKTLRYMKRLNGSGAYHKAYRKAFNAELDEEECRRIAKEAADKARDETELPWAKAQGSVPNAQADPPESSAEDVS